MTSLEEKQQIILRHYHDGESQRKYMRKQGYPERRSENILGTMNKPKENFLKVIVAAIAI